VFGAIAFALVGILFLLAAIRTFIATLYQTYFGTLPNTTIGAIAFVVFGAVIVAPLVARVLGARRAFALTSAVLGLGTFLATVSRLNWLDLVLAAAVVVAGGWWLVYLHAFREPERPSPLPVALPLALVTDFALRHAFRTVPVVDLAPPLAVPLVAIGGLVFLAAALAVLPAERSWTAPDLRGALALVAVGPLVAVGELSATNAAQVALAAGLGLGPEPARSTQIGAMVVGVGLAAGALVLARDLPRRPAAAVLLGLGGALLWLHIPGASLLGGAALAAGLLVGSSVVVTSVSRPAGGPALTSLALGVGWIAFVATAFVFYAFFDVRAVWAAIAAVALLVLIAPPVTGPRIGMGSAVLIGAISVLVPLAALVPFGAPPAAPAQGTFRLMTYNVHSGFDRWQIPSIDALAETIARESPDVLVLQEVTRGWLLTEQHDVVGVLAERLGMQYVWGPTINDLYGNALLTRMPITEVRRVLYPKEPGLRHQQRGALVARVADVTILVTHLDENADATDVRQTQVRTLLRALVDTSPAIVAGDLNALPATLEMDLLAQSGFADLALAAGADEGTFPSDRPERRIDYVWGVGVVGAQAHTVASTASDHRAVVVNITLTRRP
jgi:endonuclease/exonuclease/phosphatase family metal-dependent hydrolase